MQIFTKSNRSYQAKEIKEKDIKLFKDTLKESKLKHVVVHACYLINLASIEFEIIEKSKNALLTELNVKKLIFNKEM
jgi:endonuclease IV